MPAMPVSSVLEPAGPQAPLQRAPIRELQLDTQVVLALEARQRLLVGGEVRLGERDHHQIGTARLIALHHHEHERRRYGDHEQPERSLAVGELLDHAVRSVSRSARARSRSPSF